jgi:hypothetical protein
MELRESSRVRAKPTVAAFVGVSGGPILQFLVYDLAGSYAKVSVGIGLKTSLSGVQVFVGSSPAPGWRAPHPLNQWWL